jgi:hypothetical protein
MENIKKNWMKWLLTTFALFSLIAGLTILTVFVSFLRQNFIVSPNLNPEYGDVIENSGNIGDFFGGVIGSFWALTGVFLLYLTLQMQKEELVNQRNELQSTREVFEIQKFENTFFNLLSYQNGINSSLKINFEWYQTKGRSFEKQSKEYLGDDVFSIVKYEMAKIKECLEGNIYFNHLYNLELFNQELVEAQYLYEQEQYHVPEEHQTAFDVSPILNKLEKAFYIEKYKVTENEFNKYKNLNHFEKAKFLYGILFDKHENILGHYFRNLYHVLKYLDDTQQHIISKLGRSEDIAKVQSDFLRYSQFVQSQMSSIELLILFYNVINFPKAREFAIKYKLLENLSSDLLLDENHNGTEGIHLEKSKKNLRLEVLRNNPI